MTSVLAFFDTPLFPVLWAVVTLPSLIVLAWDLRHRNAHLMALMKAVWLLVVLYSGPVGLAIYWLAGRKEIADDNDWRRAFRSVAHCYSGCGLGEILGVSVAVGIFALGNLLTALITFCLAYAFGFALTVGPLVQDGVPIRKAGWDALISETPSIAVMEIVAIGVDLSLAKNAGMGEAIFWSSLIVSLACGLFAAYPVNLWLIRRGVKEGMMDPRQTGSAD